MNGFSSGVVRFRQVSSCEEQSVITAWRHAGSWSVFEILGANANLWLGAARRDAGAWSVLEILGVSGGPLAVLGAS